MPVLKNVMLSRKESGEEGKEKKTNEEINQYEVLSGMQ